MSTRGLSSHCVCRPSDAATSRRAIVAGLCSGFTSPWDCAIRTASVSVTSTRR